MEISRDALQHGFNQPSHLFLNGERARTWNSFQKLIPGFYASINDVAKPGEQPPDYISATGIEEISFQKVLRKDVVTPYGAFPVILANASVGLVWYNNMLKGGAMQGPLGSTEATNINNTLISPLLTWDSKITTLCAMVGGVSDLVEEVLQLEDKYNRFYDVVDREWNRVFQDIKGENLEFKLPRSSIPHQLNDFTDCRQ